MQPQVSGEGRPWWGGSAFLGGIGTVVTHRCVFRRCDFVAFSHSSSRGLRDIGGQGVAERGVVLGPAGALSVESVPEPGQQSETDPLEATCT